MATYLYSKVKQPLSDFPIEFYSELDAMRNEVRKVEVFAGERKSFAKVGFSTGDTRLSIVPVPPMAEILQIKELQSKEISQAEFEAIWNSVQAK